MIKMTESASEEFVKWLQDQINRLDTGIEAFYLSEEAWQVLTHRISERYRIELEPQNHVCIS